MLWSKVKSGNILEEISHNCTQNKQTNPKKYLKTSKMCVLANLDNYKSHTKDFHKAFTELKFRLLQQNRAQIWHWLTHSGLQSWTNTQPMCDFHSHRDGKLLNSDKSEVDICPGWSSTIPSLFQTRQSVMLSQQSICPQEGNHPAAAMSSQRTKSNGVHRAKAVTLDT